MGDTLVHGNLSLCDCLPPKEPSSHKINRSPAAAHSDHSFDPYERVAGVRATASLAA